MEKEFREFSKEIVNIDDPSFVAYKESLGVENVKFANWEKAEEVANTIKKAAREIADEYKAYLHAPLEFAALYEVVRGYHDKIQQPPGHVINSGTFRGANACVIATALRDSQISVPLITLDPFTYAHRVENESDNTDLVFVHHKQLIERLDLKQYIVSVMYWNVEYLEHFWGQDIRIAVIDTCHSYDQTKNELKTLTQHIPKGGWFISHDFMPQYTGVLRAIHEFLQLTERQYRLLNAWAYLFIQFLS